MKHLSSALLVALVALSRSAHADSFTDVPVGRRDPDRFHSPQNFAMELRFSPYNPDIDSDPKLHGSPYAKSFGDDVRILAALEFDYQPLRLKKIGSLGIGASLGYTAASGNALRKDNGLPSAGTTSLTVFPATAVVVVRVDALRDELQIPVQLYGKFGLGLAFWRGTDGNGTSVASDGVSAKGHTWGTHFALGAALDLQIFDENAARNIDDSIGINHTYLFAEWMWMNLNGLSDANALRVGTSTWVAGLSFEF